jgi:WD40 repeat protein
MRFWLIASCAASLLAADPSYTKDIVPVLQKNCVGCHQGSMKSAGLDLTSYESFKRGGKQRDGFAQTIRYISGEAKPSMPLGQPLLTAEVVDIFRAWVKLGAPDDSPNIETKLTPAKYSLSPVTTALRWSPDGRRLAVSGNGEVLVHGFDGSRFQLEKRFAGRSERILAIAWSQDGNMLVAGGGTPARFGEVQWWDVETGRMLRSAELPNDTVFGASLSPDGSKVAVGCADNTVHVFETASGKELYKIGSHENWVLGTVFSVNGKRLVSVGRDRAAKIMDANLGQFLENANTSQKTELNAVARHPGKDVIVMGGEDRYPYVYSLDRTRNMRVGDDAMFVQRLDRQEGVILALDWSSDARLIAVAGAAPKVNLYDAESGKPLGSCAGHEAGIYALAFSPDSKTVAAGGFDGKVRIYKTSDCSLVTSFVPVPLEPGSGGGQ